MNDLFPNTSHVNQNSATDTMTSTKPESPQPPYKTLQLHYTTRNHTPTLSFDDYYCHSTGEKTFDYCHVNLTRTYNEAVNHEIKEKQNAAWEEETK